jgi:hypothetical protein
VTCRGFVDCQSVATAVETERAPTCPFLNWSHFTRNLYFRIRLSRLLRRGNTGRSRPRRGGRGGCMQWRGLDEGLVAEESSERRPGNIGAGPIVMLLPVRRHGSRRRRRHWQAACHALRHGVRPRAPGKSPRRRRPSPNGSCAAYGKQANPQNGFSSRGAIALAVERSKIRHMAGVLFRRQMAFRATRSRHFSHDAIYLVDDDDATMLLRRKRDN